MAINTTQSIHREDQAGKTGYHPMPYISANDEVRIKYASKDARISNYWKYFIGQTKGLKRLDVYDKKVALENEFRDWAASTPCRKGEIRTGACR